jgi:hypothetical protein
LLQDNAKFVAPLQYASPHSPPNATQRKSGVGIGGID